MIWSIINGHIVPYILMLARGEEGLSVLYTLDLPKDRQKNFIIETATLYNGSFLILVKS